MNVCCVSICTHEYEQSNHWKLEISHHSNNGAYRQWRLELHSYRDTAKVQLCSHLNGLNRKKPFWTCMCALCVCMAMSVSCRMNNARIRCLYCVFLFMWFTIAHWVWVCSAVTECLSVCVLVELVDVDKKKSIKSWIPIDEYPIKISIDFVEWRIHTKKQHIIRCECVNVYANVKYKSSLKITIYNNKRTTQTYTYTACITRIPRSMCVYIQNKCYAQNERNVFA